ncbi:MAG: xanthine dehydrogenase accessory protein XdhC [Pseudomonadota bacterium]
MSGPVNTLRTMDAASLLGSEADLVLIEVEAANGSTPRTAGTWMLAGLLDETPCIARTIGGGQLEYLAIDEAIRSLASADGQKSVEIALGPEIGQCCGGRVSITLARVDEDARQELHEHLDHERAERPDVFVFGAGHVGRALVECISLLPVRPVLVDSRSETLELASDAAEKHLLAVPESLVATAKSGSAFVVLTHDHALDFIIAKEALNRSDAAYVGMVGSRTKRKSFENWLRREGGSTDPKNLVCPIGGFGLDDKRPEVIAALTAAEIMLALGKANTAQSTENEAAHV